MEKKNNFMQLLLYSIKEKRNWAFLSTAIILVTTLLIPYILRADEEAFIMFGIVEMFILVLINCLVDNSFLHDTSKLTYYRSKPFSMHRQITINIISNGIFTIFLIALIVLSIGFHGTTYKILDIFKMLIPWLAAIILLASLSSILSGNTLMAGAMTIFNFCLPLIIFLVTMFIFSILENLVIGFNANILNDYFYQNIYRLDYLYFVVYTEKSIDLAYILILTFILSFIFLLLHKSIKRRKNENTGFIVFDGFKYFVSVLACLIIPAFFSVSSSRYISLFSRIFISFLLAILCYYIIIAFVEKSFRISSLSIKVFVISMVVFSLITGATVAVANKYKDVVPKPEDVKIAYIGNDSWIVNATTKFLEEDGYYDEGFAEWKRNHNMITYQETENIKNVIDLHKEILQDQTYNRDRYYSNFVIAYWMKDGSIILRDYTLQAEDQPSPAHKRKGELSRKILSSTEYKKQRYPYLYDEEYYEGRNLYAKLRKGYNFDENYESINLNDLRDILKVDIDRFIIENDNFVEMFNRYYHKEGSYYLEIYEKVSNVDLNYLDELSLSDDFTNTLEYFK